MDTVASLRSQLHSRKGDWPRICQTTGLGYHWLTKFAQGRIDEPGLRKVEKLQAYIESNPLPESEPEPMRGVG